MPEPADWRDDAPQPVAADLDALARAAFDAAERLLERRRDFAPFAVVVAGGGEQALVASDPGPGAEPASQLLLERLVASVRNDRGGYRAVGFVAMVFTRTGDAVRVELEHRDGGPALVLLRTCRSSRLRRRVWTAPAGESPGSRLVWDRA
jgi:hypothetical protein